jgi:hypothetical protein
MPVLAQIAQAAQPLLTTPAIQRTRRNHGLEHATVHVLARGGGAFSGYSTDSGFFILGEASETRIERAAAEALRRLRAGETRLAIHPNCGTNLATTGLLTTLVGAVGFAGAARRAAWDRFGWVMLGMVAAVLVAQPLGLQLQQYVTTESDMGDLTIERISRHRLALPTGSAITLHQVHTRQDSPHG